jgi:hypothetical protein
MSLVSGNATLLQGLPALVGATLSSVSGNGSNFIVLFGGAATDDGSRTSSVLYIASNTAGRIASAFSAVVPVSGNAPLAVAFHSAATDSSSGRVVVFGGRSLQGAASADLWLLLVDTSGAEQHEWTFPLAALSGSRPAARFGHAATIFGRTMLVLG